MRWPRRRKLIVGPDPRELRRRRIVAELREAMRDPSLPRAYLSDMLLYAEIGKGRLDLPDDYTARVTAHARELAEMWDD